MSSNTKKLKQKAKTPTGSPKEGIPRTRAATNRAASTSAITTPITSIDINSIDEAARMTAPKAVTTEEEALQVLVNAKVITGMEQAHSLDTLIDAADKWASETLSQPGQQKLLSSSGMAASIQAITTLMRKYKDSYATLHNQITKGFKETKEQLQEMMKGEMEKMKEATDKAIAAVQDTAKQVHQSLSDGANASANSTPTYAQVAQAADPSRVARLAVESRKFRYKIDEQRAEAMKGTTIDELRKTVHQALTEMGAPASVSTRLVEKIEKARLIVIEMKDDPSAQWLRAGTRGTDMARKLNATLTQRLHTVVLKFAPITFDPEAHREEFLEVNNLTPDDIRKISWIKAAERRKPGQTHAHLYIEFTDPDLANTVMSQGLVIQNQLKQVEKSKKEPLICWNCQGYGHRATACTRPATCGNCAKEGHTGKPNISPCPEPFNKKCACCGKTGHGSFEWQFCQLQQSKRQDWKKWNPDADSPLFDSLKSPWTLGVRDNSPAHAPAYMLNHRTPPSTGANSIGITPRYRPPSQRAAKEAHKARRRELPGPSPPLA